MHTMNHLKKTVWLSLHLLLEQFRPKKKQNHVISFRKLGIKFWTKNITQIIQTAKKAPPSSSLPLNEMKIVVPTKKKTGNATANEFETFRSVSGTRVVVASYFEWKKKTKQKLWESHAESIHQWSECAHFQSQQQSHRKKKIRPMVHVLSWLVTVSFFNYPHYSLIVFAACITRFLFPHFVDSFVVVCPFRFFFDTRPKGKDDFNQSHFENSSQTVSSLPSRMKTKNQVTAF